MAAKPTVAFVAGWLLLDAMINARYPAPEPALWYLLPSIDVLGVFALLALFSALGWRVPSAARIALIALLVVVRLLRFGDGALGQYYGEPFRLHTDLALIPELVRFTYSTLGGWKATLCTGAALGALSVVCLACHRALRQAEAHLSDPRQMYVVALVCMLSAASVSLGKPRPQHAHLYDLGLGASVLPRLAREAQSLLDARDLDAEQVALVARVQQQLRTMPADLAGLGGRNVYLFVVESYGETVLERPMFEQATGPVYDAFEAGLAAGGFVIASGVLDSPIYGGRSWLAHATLGTGVRTANQRQYEVVCDQRPASMARFFADAGYRTVLVQPGTTRPWPRGEFYGFEQKYYAFDFDYRGPSHAWATMPDQYVIDFIHRREVARRSRPLFVQYVLVSSHAPWSDLPALVDDWGALDDGAIYQRLPARHYRIEWPGFDNASQAYIDSIVYDLQVLERYIEGFVDDDSLIVILGDHQPVSEVTGHDPSRGVPVHVISRNAALIEPFIARGYSRGMRPTQPPPHAGLETFLPSLLSDFSSRD